MGLFICQLRIGQMRWVWDVWCVCLSGRSERTGFTWIVLDRNFIVPPGLSPSTVLVAASFQNFPLFISNSEQALCRSSGLVPPGQGCFTG